MPDDVALRNRRSYRHRKGDHSLCRPERCDRAVGGSGTLTALPTPGQPGLLEAYRKELERAKRLDTPEGQHVMVLAAAFVGGDYTGAALASVSKELRAAMDQAMKGAPRVKDAVDELQERRRRRRSA